MDNLNNYYDDYDETYGDEAEYAEWRHEAERSRKDKGEFGAVLDQIQAALDSKRFNEAQALFDSLPLDSLNQRTQMRCHYLQGWLKLSLGQMDTAHKDLIHSLQLAVQLKARRPLAYIRYRLGVFHYRNRRFWDAEQYFLQTWNAFDDHEIDDRKLKAYVNHSLGNATLRQGRFKNAAGHYHDALDMASDFESSKLVGSVCWGLGLAYYYQGDLGVAKVEIGEALRLQQQEPIDSFLAKVTGMYGMILIELNQPLAGERELKHAIFLSEQIKDSTALVIAQGNLAESYLALGRLSEALNIAEQTLEQAYALGVASLDVAQSQQMLAKVYAQGGNYEKADAILTAAEEIMQQSGDQVKYMELLSAYGRMLIKAGDYQRAAQKLILACYLRNPSWRYL